MDYQRIGELALRFLDTYCDLHCCPLPDVHQNIKQMLDHSVMPCHANNLRLLPSLRQFPSLYDEAVSEMKEMIDSCFPMEWPFNQKLTYLQSRTPQKLTIRDA